MCVSPSLGKACSAAEITTRTLWNWRHGDDEDFKKAFEVARKLGIEAAEEEAWRRAVEGCEEPVFQGGIEVGKKTVFSDTMMIFMLKGADPAKYRERFEHTGAGGGPIVSQSTIDIGKVSTDTLERLLKETLDPELP